MYLNDQKTKGIRFEAFVRGPEGSKPTVMELFTGSPAQNEKEDQRIRSRDSKS